MRNYRLMWLLIVIKEHVCDLLVCSKYRICLIVRMLINAFVCNMSHRTCFST